MTPRQTTVLLLHAASTLFMTGLIWFVQVVHYPLFAEIGIADFARYAVVHSERTAWVVVPVMLIEMVTAVWLALAPDTGVPRRIALTGLVILAAIWLSTAFLQVPRHVRLGEGYDAGTLATLVATNWLRTGGWSLRSGIVLSLLYDTLRRGPAASRNV